MDAMTELAKLLKERENPSVQSTGIGTVISISPLKISLNSFILDKSNLFVAKHLLSTYQTSGASVGDHGDHTHTISDILQKGDKVIVIPSCNNSLYFVIDKVGDI